MFNFQNSRGAIKRATVGRAALAIAGMLCALPAGVWAQAFQSGDAIEYKVRSSPPLWERGVYVRALPNGKQVLVRQKPTTYFPAGSEMAFDTADVRIPVPAGAQANAAASPARVAGVTPANPGTTPAVSPGSAPAIPGAGLLSKEEVIAYAGTRIGADPWKNPPRDANLANIRDYIRERGTNFTADADFDARMSAISANSVHIGFAVNENRGPHPALGDYAGVWLLRAANRGSHSTGMDSSGRRTRTTTDSQAESGQLTINADGSYVWEVLRGDPSAKWLRGKWRAVRPDEMQAWEAGPALWLVQAKQGFDYMVRMGRDPAWQGWISVGAGKGRTPVEYGRRR